MPARRFARAMFFWLKKFLAFWVMPMPLCLVLLVVGAWLLRSARRAKLGRVLVTTGVLLLLVFSNKLISAALVRPLENRYPPIPELPANAPLPPALARCRYVVVLGSGNGNTPGRAALSELSQSAHARIGEAVRLLRRLPDAKLVVSGPPEGDHPSHATALARAAISLGIDESRIARIELVRDTEDESLAVQRKLGSEPFALVTSAWHMPRAMALFHAAGLQPLACPADFNAHDDGHFHFTDLLCDTESLERSTWAVRERLGYLWIALRGKT